ncbi:MAG: hypothetical protein AB1505_18980 [Candidatus Latescibacterota bacterium]
MTQAVESSEATHNAVRGAGTAVAKETAEAAAAIAALAQQYDTIRAVILQEAPYEGVGPVSSTCPTSDDLLRYAEEAEAVLVAHGQDAWAQGLVAGYQAAVDAATREWVDGVTARTAEQKARQQRREAAAELEALLVRFQRILRSAYGRSSQEYRSICPRGQGEAELAEEAGATGGEGAAPAPV